MNRYRVAHQETKEDHFADYWGFEKPVRFGFENNEAWKEIEKNPTLENLAHFRAYYNTHYYGPTPSGNRRVYIAFSYNVHVVLYRLHQANLSLKNVKVVGIEALDLMTHPPGEIQTLPRSFAAYHHFAELLHPLFVYNSSYK